jgi:hypothetical protein
VALGGNRRWRCSGCFSFSPLLLLPLAFRLFYCSSSFFPFSPLVLGKEMPMVMLSFVCWFLASLTFSSSPFLLPIPCSTASGSYGWCCRKMKVMVMFFFSYFSLLGGRSHAGFFLLGLILCDFPNFIPSCCPLFLLSLVRSSSVFFFVFSFPFCLLSLLSPSLSLPSSICLSSCVPHCHLSSLVSFPLPCVQFFL